MSVLRGEIPKPNGVVRKLGIGIPTVVVDRVSHMLETIDFNQQHNYTTQRDVM